MLGRFTWNAVRLAALSVTGLCALTAHAVVEPWVEFEGTGDGPGAGKRVVLVSGDEEYRSEEGLPLLGRMLSEHFGFHSTVLFAWNEEGGFVDPNHQGNIPGMEALDDADLMIILTRFRNPTDAQMAALDRYLKAGKPVVGLRTSTHGFQFPGDSPWAHYSNGYSGPTEGWQGGFGRVVLGEQWIMHHGGHKADSTHGIIPAEATDHPITRGLSDRDVWGSTNVYGLRLPLPGDSFPVVLGQVTRRAGRIDTDDLFFGMRQTDSEPRGMDRNNPMMPVAWTRTYQVPGGELGRAFTSTMGASTDLLTEGTRRMVLQGALWALGLEDAIPEEGVVADIVGPYEPTQFNFHSDEYFAERALHPAQFAAHAGTPRWDLDQVQRLAAEQDYAAAIALFEEVKADTPEAIASIDGLKMAVVYAVAAGPDAHRAHSEWLLGQFPEPELATDAERAVKGYVLVPWADNADMIEQSVARCRFAVEQATEAGEEVYLPWFYGSLGIALYRAGDTAEAAEWLARSAGDESPYISSLALAFHAMAEHANGNADAAAASLAAARERVEAFPAPRTDAYREEWTDILMSGMALEEAEGLIGGA